MASICVLGLGKMGTAMCRRLCSQGHHVVVWNRTFLKAEQLAQEQDSEVTGRSLVTAKPSLEEVFACLAPDALILAVMSDTPTLLDLLNANKVFSKTSSDEKKRGEGALTGRVLANMASASPDEGRQVAQRAEELGAGYLDCAYCGPPAKVLAGAGQIFASSDTPDLVNKYTPLLSCLGGVVDCGKVGASRALDYGVVDLAFVNFLSFASNAEMMQREGVDMKVFFEQAAKRLATVPGMFENAHSRMSSRKPEDYLANPTATLGNWRSFWASRLPYLQNNQISTRVPDIMISLLDEAAGPSREHINADVTRLQEIVRFKIDDGEEAITSPKRARKE